MAVTIIFVHIIATSQTKMKSDAFPPALSRQRNPPDEARKRMGKRKARRSEARNGAGLSEDVTSRPASKNRLFPSCN